MANFQTRRRRRGLVALSAVVVVAAGVFGLQRQKASAAQEKREAATAESLFDGKTLEKWVTGDGKPVTKGWAVEDGCIARVAHGGGDIFTAEEFEDFELTFEWKVTAGVNSGVKYRVRRYDGQPLGPEYQILDESGGRQKPRSETGSLYALYETAAERRLNPTGEWNEARIIARGSHIEHWLNGVKLLEADTGSPEWSARLAKSKFARRAGFGTGSGRIMLTDHAPSKGAAGPDKVWFRNMTVRRLAR